MMRKWPAKHVQTKNCKIIPKQTNFFFVFLFFSNVNQLGFYMRYHLFLHYEWFLQNLEKDFIRTNMHTTVCKINMLKSVALLYGRVCLGHSIS